MVRLLFPLDTCVSNRPGLCPSVPIRRMPHMPLHRCRGPGPDRRRRASPGSGITAGAAVPCAVCHSVRRGEPPQQPPGPWREPPHHPHRLLTSTSVGQIPESRPQRPQRCVWLLLGRCGVDRGPSRNSVLQGSGLPGGPRTSVQVHSSRLAEGVHARRSRSLTSPSRRVHMGLLGSFVSRFEN